MTHAVDDSTPFGAFAPSALESALIAAAASTPLGRGGARRMVTAALCAARNGRPLDAKLYGLGARLYLAGNPGEPKALLNPGQYNQEEYRFLRSGLPAQGGVFLDIGANIGLYVLQALSWRAPGLRIVAIEPNSVTLRRLRFNIASANAGPVEIVGNAVSDREHELKLSMTEGNLGGARIDAEGDVVVLARPLMAILRDLSIERIDAMKIDVEDHEAEALMPFYQDAPASLWPARLVIEHRGRESLAHDPIKFCLANGYALAGFNRSNALLRRG